MIFYTHTSNCHMQHFPDLKLQQARIRWPWLTLSCVSLLVGFSYLAMVDLVGPVQLTQNQTEQQP